MKEYKVGDEVRIKSLTWYRRNADANGAASGGFVKGMATYCGRKAHIAEIDADGHMLLDFPSQHYWWSPDMFEPEPRYKKGDAVIIKSKDWYDTNKGKDGYVQFPETSVDMNESMSEYCGKATTVRDITPRGTYKLEIDDGEYHWHDKMFEYTDVPIEYNVGEKFKEDGVTFEVVLDENNTCEGCAFDGNHQYMCQKLSCGSTKRTDKQNVMFKEVTSEDEVNDYPVGTVFTLEDGKHFLVEEGNDCQKCAFHNTQYCGKYLCLEGKRADETSVIFKEYGSPEPEWAEAEEIKEEPIPNTPKIKTGISIIIDERLRQLTTKGYDNAHDDEHNKGELAHAAALFAYPEISSYVLSEENWPEGKVFYHPTEKVITVADRIKELAKAGALITAEIDRLNRLDLSSKYTEQSTRKKGFSD